MPPPEAALTLQVEQQHPMPLDGTIACGPSELLALVGPSGAGKTSMLRVMAGLLRPQRGRVVAGGEVWCDTERGVFVPPQSRRVGLVFQDYALMPHLSAVENVALSLLHLDRASRLARARQWLDHLQLSAEQQQRRPAGLSGGQQQRVAVARALAREPRLLLLDEPFASVDPVTRQGLYRLLADLRRELAVPIVLVTHDLDEARLLADRLVVMDAGKVLQAGAPDAIHRAPRNARVAELVGIVNRFRGEWLGPSGRPGRAHLRWAVPGREPALCPVLEVRDKGRLAAGQALTWVIPSEGIALADAEDGRAGGFGATVSDARFLGEITLATIALDAAPGVSVSLTLAGPQRRLAEAGRRLRLHLDTDLVHVMPLR